jgi:hypothetical protein
VSIIDFLNQIWTQILDITAIFVTPDWGFLVGMLPVIVLFGLVMPFVTFLLIGTMAYLITKPRVKVAFVEGPRVAESGPGGAPVFHIGLPHCQPDAPNHLSGTRHDQGRGRPDDGWTETGRRRGRLISLALRERLRTTTIHPSRASMRR